MAKHKPICPICDQPAPINPHGFYVCPEHKVIPYDYAMGDMGRDKALDQMASWGVIIKRKPKKTTAVPSVQAYDSGTIPELINKLKTCTDKRDKRRLRAALRKLGHTGGAR